MSMYDLHSLGWFNFQQLCLTISREVLGQTVESFLTSKDGGRDGAFSGTWNPEKGERLAGRFVIQCKFTSKLDRSLKMSDLSDEVEKVKRLAAKNRCDCYLLITNFGISGIGQEKIEEYFLAAGVKQFRCFGADWISEQIRESTRLRMLVPRVYGLGDLSQILDQRAYAQARALLESMREDLSRVVLTAAYSSAVEALEKHGFVLLLGEPACGKTTIAAMLAMGALDRWKLSTLKLERSAQVAEHWNAEDPRQFFWVDDAFGVTQYEATLALDWNRVFPKIKAMINSGARVVLTSRDYIYSRAKQDLKESAFPLMHESQVAIDVREIAAEERRQILYNHIKLGNQPKNFRQTIKPFLDEIAGHPRFTPEIARRLGDRLFTKSLLPYREGLRDFVERPTEFLKEVIEGLDRHSRAALALIFMRNGFLQNPIAAGDSESSALARLGSTIAETIISLRALENSLTVRVREGGRFGWTFKHPTVGDAYGALLLDNPEIMDIYLQGAPAEKLANTITCGDVGLEGAVVVPSTLYNLLFSKLETFLTPTPDRLPGTNEYEAIQRAYRFLANRCDREFLEAYLARHPEILESTSKAGLYFNAKVQLWTRLFEFGLLPEGARKELAKTAIDRTVDELDTRLLNDRRLREMLQPEENQELVSRLKGELIPNLSDARRDWEDNHSSEQDPESYMEPFLELLDALESEFPEDVRLRDLVHSQEQRVRAWIDRTYDDYAENDLRREYEDEDPFADDTERYTAFSPTPPPRSIFEDIDE